MDDNEVPDLIRTLTAAGFELSNVERKPNFMLLHLVRADEFRIPIRYLLAYAGRGRVSSSDAKVLGKIADRDGASAVVVVSDSQGSIPDLVLVTKDELYCRLGGPVSSMLPLEPEYGRDLVTLGLNKLPDGVRGRPDDLFEVYVHAGLQFVLTGHVIRYGQGRRFEAVPDGLALGKRTPMLLYDCKAADNMYEFGAATIRQFSDYVRDFHRRYEKYIGRLHCFLAISSAFQDHATLLDRSGELYGKCGVPLVCMSAADLARTVTLFSNHTAFRQAVDWSDLLRPPMLDFSRVEAAVGARGRDGVIKE